MHYDLPITVKQSLASRGARLHHLLWHAIRNNWHDFSQAERDSLQQSHPGWVPKIARFVHVAPTPQNPNGIAINFDAGESFLYMHRRMILIVNVQLAALGEPALVPWPAIPTPDDPDYPVPGRGSSDVKGDAFYADLKARADQVLDPNVLQQNSLARIGAYVESALHDFFHMRWAAESAGQMASFPELDPAVVAPTIDPVFDPPAVDWLGHPWSSHVNSDFWKLHGWVDQCADAWRIANGLDTIQWTDTWEGDTGAPPPGPEGFSTTETLEHLHDHFAHGAHHDHELLEVFKTINGFEHCHIGFDYLLLNQVPIPTLAGSR